MGCASPWQGGNHIGEHQQRRALRGQPTEQHAGLGNRMICGDERASQRPGLSQRHADHDTDEGSDRRLPGERRCQLPVHETQSFWHGKVVLRRRTDAPR